jgi:hypothetical protein
MADCEEPNPDHPEVLCDKQKPCYAYHCNAVAGMTWGFRDIPGDKTSDPGRLIGLAQQIRRYDR